MMYWDAAVIKANKDLSIMIEFPAHSEQLSVERNPSRNYTDVISAQKTAKSEQLCE